MRAPIACLIATAAAGGLAVAGTTTTTAQAAVKVSGRLEASKGFRVVALGPSGTGVMRRVGRGGRFELKLKRRIARGATLQLIARSGSYYGPLVLRRERRKGFLRLAGESIALGRIVRARGAARPRRRVARRFVQPRATRLTRRGVPRGSGRLGLVAASAGRTAQVGETPGGDLDRDGIPDPFDVDDDGDEVLDTSDAAGGPPDAAEISSSLPLGLEDSLNMNATGVTRSLVDERLRSDLNLLFTVHSDAVSGEIDTVDVDCGGLPYCRPGSGTAVVRDASANAERGRWVDFDPNHDGLPNLDRDGPVHVINIWPRVPTAGIAPGDAFAFLVRTGGATTTLPASLVSYFTTTPAAQSYDSGAGPTTVTYPVPPGSPGTAGHPIELASERLTVTFWRPQRLAIEGAEDGTFIDIGHLNYGVRIDSDGVCAPADYSNLSPTLAPASKEFLDKSPEVVLRDSADDAPPSASRLLSFTVDIGTCMRRNGIEPSGKNLVFSITAEDDARDIARQHLTVHVP